MVAARAGGVWRDEQRVTRERGKEEDAMTMLVAILLHGGAAADNTRGAGGGQCYTRKGADDNGKTRVGGGPGRRRSSKINKHKALNLSPFTVIFDNAERTQHRQIWGKGVY